MVLTTFTIVTCNGMDTNHTSEPSHDKTNNMTCVPSEDSDQPGHSLGSLATQQTHSEDADQTGQMPRLIRVFAGRPCHFVGLLMRWLIYSCFRNNHALVYRILPCIIRTLFYSESRV